MKKRGSLRTTLIFLFLILGLVPLLIVGIFSYINLNNNAESLVFYSLGLFTEMANSKLLDYFNGIEKEGQVIAATQDIYQNMKVLEEAGWDRNDPAWKKNAAILDDFLSTVVGKLGLAKVILTDPAGKVVYDTGKEMIGTSLAQSCLLYTSTGFTLRLTPPSLGLDMAGALLGSVIAEKMMLEDNFILIKNTMHAFNEDIEGSLLLLPETGSLEKIYRQMGVC